MTGRNSDVPDLAGDLLRSLPARRLSVSSAEDGMTAAVQERLADGFDLPLPRDWRVLSYEDNTTMGYPSSTVLVADPNDAVYEVAATVRLREVPRA